MSKAICIHQYGGPEVLRWEEIEVGDPGPGQLLHPSCRHRPELYRRLPPHRPVSLAVAALDAGHGGGRPGRGSGGRRDRI